MGLTGNLKTMSTGDLLQWAALAQKSGTLVVSRGDLEKRVFFKEGRILSSASTDPREYLGQFLMSYDYITEEELNKAMQVQQESGMLLGKILVTIGVIEEKDLTRLMKTKAEETIYDLFLWREGDFRFEDGVLPEYKMVPLSVDLTGLMMEGSRRADEWLRIREVIPRDDLVPVPRSDLDRDQYGEGTKSVIDAINGKRTIEEISLESRASRFVVARTVRDLIESEEATLEKPEKPEGSREEPEKEERLEGSVLLREGQSALKEGDYSRAIRLYRTAHELDQRDEKISKALEHAEDAVRGALRDSSGIDPEKTPRLLLDMAEISEMDLTPNEGFVLSRIDGTWDISSIVKISPIREIDGLLIFDSLKSRGIIAIE